MLQLQEAKTRLQNKDIDLEKWAKANNIDLSPEIYLSYQRSLIIQELEMIGIYLELPGAFLESLNSAQFAEVISGSIKRQRKQIG